MEHNVVVNVLILFVEYKCSNISKSLDIDGITMILKLIWVVIELCAFD